MTIFGSESPRVPKLIADNTKVVRAKPQRPSGAGLANLRFAFYEIVSLGCSRELKRGLSGNAYVETRLKVTTESCQACLAGGIGVQIRISAVVVPMARVSAVLIRSFYFLSILLLRGRRHA